MVAKRLFKIASLGFFLILLTVSFTETAQPARQANAKSEPEAKTVNLKAVSFLPGMSMKAKLLRRFCEDINKVSNGEIKIRLLGGPEVIGPLEQGQAVAKGVVDIAMIPPAFISGSAPEIVFPLLTRITQEEELERGIIEKLQPFYKKANLYCIGELFGVNDPQFMIFTVTKKIESPGQLNGMTIGGSGAMMKPVAEALGFDLKTMPISEVYTALERKLIEGYLSPAGGLISFGAHEVLRYAIDHPFFADYVVLVMNPKAWNNLSEKHQNIIKNTLIKEAPEFGRLNNEDEMKARAGFKKAGVQFIKFAPSDREKFIETVYSSMWEAWIARMPEIAPKFRKLLSP